ncbi:hypothetical protein ABZ746_17175 [Streptomyces sp. NPDC020096]
MTATVMLPSQSAWADDGGNGGSSSTTPPSQGKTESPDTISAESHVQVVGSPNNNGTPMTSSDTSWSPPVCWYEPRYTPDEYKKSWDDAYRQAGSFERYVWEEQQQLQKIDYNRGKDGLWWHLTYRQGISLDEMNSCKEMQGDIWVPKGDPTPPDGAITPEILSKIAYAATKLPAPPVELSPSAGNQVVNLPTYIKFNKQLDRVWVTASIDYRGLNIAATTVATPVAFKVDAGTPDADPQSCTYDLTKSSSGYQVDSSNAPCNITYRRSSGSSTYPLKAQITWKVTWTASTNPDGAPQQPALPDGLSTYNEDVTVKEIQTVVR